MMVGVCSGYFVCKSNKRNWAGEKKPKIKGFRLGPLLHFLEVMLAIHSNAILLAFALHQILPHTSTNARFRALSKPLSMAQMSLYTTNRMPKHVCLLVGSHTPTEKDRDTAHRFLLHCWRKSPLTAIDGHSVKQLSLVFLTHSVRFIVPKNVVDGHHALWFNQVRRPRWMSTIFLLVCFVILYCPSFSMICAVV